MKLQDQVITLEQAKKLKELGVNGDSAFRWLCLSEVNGLNSTYDYWEIHYDNPIKVCKDRLPAYTVAELGQVLPFWVEDPEDKQCYPLDMYRFNPDWEWHIAYQGTSDKSLISLTAHTEAEARAKMLIHLLENNHTTPEQVNQSLNK